MYKSFFFVLTILATSELRGQGNDAELATRGDQIQAERLERAAHVHPEEPTAIEKYLKRIHNVVRQSGLRVQVGGLGPGAGLAIGSVLQQNGFQDRVAARVWGTISPHAFYSAGTGVELNDIAAHGLTFALVASHSDAPQLEYYGPGPNSSIHNRTDFRREDTHFDFLVESREHRIVPACHFGKLLVNVGPGTNRNLASTESVFSPNEAPGIDVQDNFWIGGCSVLFEWRDLPGKPHKGTYAAAGYDQYHAQNDQRFSFGRLSAVAEQYISFFNQKRVVALRAKTELSLHSADQVTPFYLQPTLGSDTELRGFRRYRFYDENSIAMNAEYRWEINTGFDAALFVDSSKVFHRPEDISLSRLEYSAGFGFRFKSSSSVVARLDTGFGREGVQLWFRFDKVF